MMEVVVNTPTQTKVGEVRGFDLCGNNGLSLSCGNKSSLKSFS